MKNVKIACLPKTYPTAKSLAESLGCKVLLQDSTLPLARKIVLNWGRSDLSQYSTPLRVINSPEAVAIAANKLRTLETIGDTFGVEFTTDRDEALTWLNDEHETVVVRYTLTGSGGEGIEIYDADAYDSLPEAPLYTKYFNGRYEFRVHVGNVASEDRHLAFDIQRKGLREDAPEGSGMIRNLENGYTFVRNDVVPTDVSVDALERMFRVCELAVRTIGLDLGAVDVRMKRNGEFKILEVNSAPGLSGTTLENYTNFIRENLI